MKRTWILLAVSLVILGGCATAPPVDTDKIIRLEQGEKAPFDGVFMGKKVFDTMVRIIMDKNKPEYDPNKGQLVNGE